jgi:hypothetical protein
MLFRSVLLAFLVIPLLGFQSVKAQCKAPATWFPHAMTPEPDFHKPIAPCEFHQWAWQEFLWLTQPDENGRLRFLSNPTEEMLFSPGRAPAPLESVMVQQRLKKQILRLTPRSLKERDITTISAINQAASQGIIVDRNGHPVFYATFVSPEYYEFVRTKHLYLKANYQAAAADLNFPVKAVELKTSWRVVEEGDATDNFFTTKAMIPALKCGDGTQTCTGTTIKVDMTNQLEVTVALVGIHVVGVLEGHPEFVWSTFEHVDNAPDLPLGTPVNSATAVHPNDFTFYRANTAAKDCNPEPNVSPSSFDVATGKLTPQTDLFRQFAFGGGDNQDTTNIKSLNQSVHDQLTANSVWKNYFLVGGVWFADGKNLKPGLNGIDMQMFAVGSVQLSNSTMETFTQQPFPTPVGPRSNCFSCHKTASQPSLGAKNLNLSHILHQGLIDREELPQLASMNLTIKNLEAIQLAGFNSDLNAIRTSPLWNAPVDDSPIRSYQDVQKLLDDFVADNNVPIFFSPHGAFWRNMTRAQFIEGNIPNVSDPLTSKPLKILVVGNAEQSNLIMSLRGAPDTIFDPDTGSIGRMPPSGPFMPTNDIERLANWINAGAPE